MFGHKAIQVTSISAIMMICYDARYLLVNIDEGNGGMFEGNERDLNKNRGILDDIFGCSIFDSIVCLGKLIEPIKNCVEGGEANIISCIEGLVQENPSCDKCICGILDKIPGIGEAINIFNCKKGSARNAISENMPCGPGGGASCAPGFTCNKKQCVKIKPQQEGQSCGGHMGPRGKCASGLDCVCRPSKLSGRTGCGTCVKPKPRQEGENCWAGPRGKCAPGLDCVCRTGSKLSGRTGCGECVKQGPKME